MFAYLVLKTVHILAAMVFLGTGFGSAWYRLRADASEDLRVIVWCQREIVRADWYFTVPSGVALPLTGLAMVLQSGMPWTTPWLYWGLAGYFTAGALWVPAAWLQLELRRLSERALETGERLPAEYHRHARTWTLLGVPSFLAAIGTVWVMVAKHI